MPGATVAAVQAAPVFLDRDATVDKACALIREAGRAGARLVAFPEVFVPGFPHWIYLDRPQANEHYFVELVREAVDVPGPATEALGGAARDAGAWVVIGVNERSRRSAGELFNTNLVFGPDGALAGWHRKLMPTYAEKMIWSFGDGSTLRVYDTPLGRLGTLCCGENTNPLARFTLIAQGEQIHVANYPARPAGDAVDLAYNIQIRAAAHAFEGKCYVVVAGSLLPARESHAPHGDPRRLRAARRDPAPGRLRSVARARRPPRHVPANPRARWARSTWTAPRRRRCVNSQGDRPGVPIPAT